MADITYPDKVSYTILVAGTEIPSSYGVLSIEVHKEVNRIGSAKIEIIDGGVAVDDEFAISNSENFAPGKEITIKAGFMNEGQVTEDIIFKGVVVKHGLNIRDQQSLISIECRDKALKLTLGRKNEIFTEKKDSEIITQILNASGVEKQVTATTVTHPEMVQHYCTDWDFVLMRADANSMIALVDDGKVSVIKPSLSATPKVKAKFGDNLLEFNANIDARTQLKKAKGYAWDSATQKMIDSSGTALSGAIGGTTKSTTAKSLVKVMGLAEYSLQSTAEVQQSSLQAWASSRLMHSTLSMIRGKITIFGAGKLKPGDIIEVEGVSDRFNGKLFVGGVQHVIEEGLWKTNALLGVNFDTYVEDTPLVNPQPNGGLFSPMSGLHTGIVKQIHEDKAGQFRVKVSIPTLRKDTMGLWARMSNLYASNQVGSFFYPEVNDEVVIGFMNEDPQNPVILGMLYSKKIKPPLTPEKKNSKKAIITKSKLTILFNEEDKSIEISTPANNKILLDDKNGEILLEDKNKNKILMSKAGIELKSAKDIKITAGSAGKVIVQGMAIEMKATQGFKAQGLKIELKASTMFQAEGSASAMLKSGGQTAVKGSIVMIN